MTFSLTYDMQKYSLKTISMLLCCNLQIILPMIAQLSLH